MATKKAVAGKKEQTASKIKDLPEATEVDSKATKTVMTKPKIPIPAEGVIVHIQPTKVNDTMCISISEFAFLMGWTVQNVYYHINHEDTNKRIKSVKIFRTLLVIPYAEYLRLAESPYKED